jgi:hypothetical protein
MPIDIQTLHLRANEALIIHFTWGGVRNRTCKSVPYFISCPPVRSAATWESLPGLPLTAILGEGNSPTRPILVQIGQQYRTLHMKPNGISEQTEVAERH